MLNLEGLKKLDLDSISLRVSGCRDLHYIQGDIGDWLENDDMINKNTRDIKIEILGSSLENDESIRIGEMRGYFFESELARDDISFLYLCDAMSADLEMMASAIINEHGNIREEFCDCHETLMYIDRIYLEEKYRGLGISSYVIENLNEILEFSINLYPRVVLILLPMPQDRIEEGLLSEMKNEEKKHLCKQKLVKLYKNLGFNEIENTDYMLKKVEDPFLINLKNWTASKIN